MIIRAVLGVLVLALSAFLFSKASGSLALKDLNIISFCFYDILIFTWVGAFLILMGFRSHYLVKRIESDEIILKTCLIIAYTMIAFPAAMVVFNRVLIGKVTRPNLRAYYRAPTLAGGGENFVFRVCLTMALAGTLATGYVFFRAGNFPLLSVALGGNPAYLRASIGRNFEGNQFVRNILMLSLTPLFSYLAYLYMRTSKRNGKKWAALFAYLFALSLIIKTYNLEKGPVIYYLFYFYALEVLLGNDGLMNLLRKVVFVGFCMILFFYYGMMGYQGNLLTFSTGPLGRVFMTQVACLFLHVQLFPNHAPYLEGASLPTAIAGLAGSSRSWVRSGRVVMEFFNPDGVAAGTAGVMNSFFPAEAYANWGIRGVIVAPILVALCFSMAFALALTTKKTPLSMTLYLGLFIQFTNAIQGGFVDFVYNFGAILLLSLFGLLYALLNRGEFVFTRWNRAKPCTADLIELEIARLM